MFAPTATIVAVLPLMMCACAMDVDHILLGEDGPPCYFAAHDDDLCYILPGTSLPWDDGDVACQQYGGWLAHARSYRDMTLLRELLVGFDWSVAWIGAYKRNTNWFWIPTKTEARPSAYNNWVGGEEPDSWTSMECAFVDPKSDYRWRDERCNVRMSYICQASVGSSLCRSGGTMIRRYSEVLVDGSVCLLVSAFTSASWQEARAACRLAGADLAEIRSAQLNYQLLEARPGVDAEVAGYWIGLSRVNWAWSRGIHGGDASHSSGEEVTDAFWRPGRPNGEGTRVAMDTRDYEEHLWTNLRPDEVHNIVCQVDVTTVAPEYRPVTTPDDVTTTQITSPSTSSQPSSQSTTDPSSSTSATTRRRRDEDTTSSRSVDHASTSLIDSTSQTSNSAATTQEPVKTSTGMELRPVCEMVDLAFIIDPAFTPEDLQEVRMALLITLESIVVNTFCAQIAYVYNDKILTNLTANGEAAVRVIAEMNTSFSGEKLDLYMTLTTLRDRVFGSGSGARPDATALVFMYMGESLMDTNPSDLYLLTDLSKEIMEAGVQLAGIALLDITVYAKLAQITYSPPDVFLDFMPVIDAGRLAGKSVELLGRVLRYDDGDEPGSVTTDEAQQTVSPSVHVTMPPTSDQSTGKMIITTSKTQITTVNKAITTEWQIGSTERQDVASTESDLTTGKPDSIRSTKHTTSTVQESSTAGLELTSHQQHSMTTGSDVRSSAKQVTTDISAELTGVTDGAWYMTSTSKEISPTLLSQASGQSDPILVIVVVAAIVGVFILAAIVMLLVRCYNRRALYAADNSSTLALHIPDVPQRVVGESPGSVGSCKSLPGYETISTPWGSMKNGHERVISGKSRRSTRPGLRSTEDNLNEMVFNSWSLPSDTTHNLRIQHPPS